jgi:hypothetical protein
VGLVEIWADRAFINVLASVTGESFRSAVSVAGLTGASTLPDHR